MTLTRLPGYKINIIKQFFYVVMKIGKKDEVEEVAAWYQKNTFLGIN